MKALKGLLIYIGLVLAIILGLGLILLCIMYFVPSFRIAGIGLVHYNKTTDEETINLDLYNDYNDVVINVSSKKVGINVVPTDQSNIIYSLDLSIFGFSTERVEYQVVKNIDVKDGVLQININVTEPNGAISTSDSAVTIKVPVSVAFGLVTNTRTGDVEVGDEDLSLDITDLSVSTSKGDLELINLGYGEEERSLTLQSLSLSTDKGEFDLSSIHTLTVLDKIKLVANDGEFVFKNLYASLDITGTGIKLKADNIKCGSNGFSFIAENGFFDVGLLSCDVGAENTIIAENLSLEIDEISGKTGIVATYGDVDVGTLNNYTIIENKHGNVTVDTAKDTIFVKTEMGDISVDEYYATGKFTSKKGDITVNSKGDFVAEYYTEIHNVDGNVKIRNDINRLLVTTTGRSRVIVAFAKVKSGAVFQHKINTNTTSGSCVVYLPTVGVEPYRFIAKGVISGEVGTPISASEYDQYYPSDSVANKNASLFNCCFEFIGRIEFKGHSRDDITGLEI